MHGVTDLVLHATVIGQHQEAFRIGVQSTCGVDVRHFNVFFQRRVRFVFGELANHAVGFI